MGKKKWLLRLALLIALADVVLAGLIGAAVLRPPTEDVRDAQAQSVTLRDEDRALALGTALSYVTLSSEPQTAGNRVEIRLSNQPESPYSVAVELIDVQTHAVLATTGRIDPGYCLPTLTLDETPDGMTMCLARLHVYSMATGEYLGTAAKQVLLNAE